VLSGLIPHFRKFFGRALRSILRETLAHFLTLFGGQLRALAKGSLASRKPSGCIVHALPADFPHCFTRFLILATVSPCADALFAHQPGCLREVRLASGVAEHVESA